MGTSVRDAWREAKFSRAKKLGRMALVGVPALVVGLMLTVEWAKIVFVLVAVFLFVPWFFYVILLTIWHWKQRYRGEHSDLWGALLLVETSGWFKIIYWFRHILPDWRGTGRYSQ